MAQRPPTRPTPASTKTATAAPPTANRRAESAFAEFEDTYAVPERYLLEAEHARGGLGRIIRARDQLFDRPVAIKELLRPSVTGEERFVREAMITARLEHPGVVPVYEVGKLEDGRPYYAMKFLAGSSMKELLAQRQRMSERLALLPNFIAVVETVAFAHSKGVVHRDLKPDNVVIGNYGETFVVDWGLAKELHEAERSETRATPYRHVQTMGLTATGSVLGTPAYMAPEQALGADVDERTDIYSLGAVLYHLITGGPPHSGSSSSGIIRALRTGHSPVKRVAPREAPEDLCAICFKALAQNPAQRYQRAIDLASDLRRFQAGRLVSARSYTRLERASRWAERHRALVSVIAAAAVISVAVGALAIRRVIIERNVATDERRRAEQALAQTEAARQQMILGQARAVLDRDPTEALAWLKHYSGDNSDEASAIAIDAYSLGVAHRVVREHGAAVYTAVGRPGRSKEFLTSSVDRTIRLWNAETGASRILLLGMAENGVFGVSADGDFVASATDAGTLVIQNIDSQEGLEWEGMVPTIARAIEFLPDGRLALGLVDAPYLRLVRWRENPSINELSGATAAIQNLRVAADGTTIAACTASGDLLIWRAADGSIALRGTCDSSRYGTLEYSADGSLLAASLPDGTIALWSLRNKTHRIIGGSSTLVCALAFSPNGQELLAGSMNGAVHLYDLSNDTEVTLWMHTGIASYTRFGSGGRVLISSGIDGKMHYLDRLARRQGQLRGHRAYIYALLCLNDCAVLVSGDGDGELRIWHRDTLERQLLGHTGQAMYHAIQSVGPNGTWVATDGIDGKLRLWHSLQTSRVITTVDGVAYGLAAPDDRRWIATSALTGQLAISHLGTEGERETSIKAHRGPVRALVAAPRGDRLYTAGADGLVVEWDADLRLVRRLTNHRYQVYRLALSESGGVLASGAEDGSIHVIHLDSGEVTALEQHSERVNALRFIGETLVSISADRTLRWWNVLGREGGTIHADPAAFPVSIGVCGTVVVSAWSDGNWRADDILLGPLGSGRLTGRSPRAISCSAAARTIAVGDTGGTIHLIEFSGSRRMLLRDIGASGISSLALSDDGHDLISTTYDGRLSRWSLPPLQDLADLPFWLSTVTNFSVRTPDTTHQDPPINHEGA